MRLPEGLLTPSDPLDSPSPSDLSS
jgi:hypothetical protein